MLLPKRVKHRKQMRGRMTGKAWRGSNVDFGDYGLKAMEPCWLTDRQIEAARIAMTRFIKRGGKIWIRVFPDKPITKKPQETRMGKGKGAPEQWVAVIKPGRILFEMEGVGEADARRAMQLAGAKCRTVAQALDNVVEKRGSGDLGTCSWPGERDGPATRICEPQGVVHAVEPGERMGLRHERRTRPGFGRSAVERRECDRLYDAAQRTRASEIGWTEQLERCARHIVDGDAGSARQMQKDGELLGGVASARVGGAVRLGKSARHRNGVRDVELGAA